MKFSSKGKAKILDNHYWFLEEFNQDDFNGAIILTIEEAKQLLKGCNHLHGLFHALNMYDNANEMLKLIIKINNKIEQTENIQ